MLKGGKESYGVAVERDREEGMGDPALARAPIRSRVLMFGNHKAASGLGRGGSARGREGGRGLGPRDDPDQNAYEVNKASLESTRELWSGRESREKDDFRLWESRAQISQRNSLSLSLTHPLCIFGD